jgi:type VI secretion system protein ImpG
LDPRLLSAYDDELRHLRELAREFGEEHEGAAAYLGLKTPNSPDPYVERLLEGVAFLAARVKVQLDEQFPKFTQHLLQAVQPNYVAPMPSMCVVGLQPKAGNDALAGGVTVPRHSEITADLGDGSVPIQYRTGHDVTLYPLRIASVEYLSSRTAVARHAAAAGVRAEAGLRVRFAATGAVPLKAITPGPIALYLSGSGRVPGELYRQLLGDAVAVVGQPAGASAFVPLPLPQAMGFADDENLLPHSGRSFRGYRILAEYFACPKRFLFAALSGLDRLFSASEGEECDVVFLFRRKAAVLEGAVNESNINLFATPAINLFEKQADRIRITPEEQEFLVIPDRTRPLDYEVFKVIAVTADDGKSTDIAVAPLYAFGAHHYDVRKPINYVTRIVPSRLRTREQRRLGLENYTASETWISLVAPRDEDQSSHDGQGSSAARASAASRENERAVKDIRTLGVRALVTNRDMAMPLAERDVARFGCAVQAVEKVALLLSPTRPRPPRGLGDAGWRAIAQLVPNFSSLVDGTANDASVLRDHLALYSDAGKGALNQVEGIVSLESKPVMRRVVASERNAFARGHRIRIVLHDHSDEDGLMYLFAAVIDRFISEFVSVNSFAETVFESSDQGSFASWPPRMGTRPTI